MCPSPSTISTRFPPDQPIEQFVDHCRHLGSLGIEHVVCIMTGPWTSDSVHRLADAVPAVAAIE